MKWQAVKAAQLRVSKPWLVVIWLLIIIGFGVGAVDLVKRHAFHQQRLRVEGELRDHLVLLRTSLEQGMTFLELREQRLWFSLYPEKHHKHLREPVREKLAALQNDLTALAEVWEAVIDGSRVYDEFSVQLQMRTVGQRVQELIDFLTL